MRSLGLLLVALICASFLRVSDAGFCTSSYPCAYTCYSKESYSEQCGLAQWWQKCSAYRRKAKSCHRNCYRQFCCTGYTGTSCTQPLCFGSTTCPNGGRCQSPDNCKCLPGFAKPRCEDVDECLLDTECEVCENTFGSYRCTCHSGYVLNNDGKTCRDINECENEKHGCDHKCNNTVGSRECTCYQGYTLAEDKQTCNDVDECLLDTECEVCENTFGSYRCTCHSGYELNNDWKTCRDIDECKYNNNACSYYCINVPGSYHCNCPPGFRLESDGRICSDINECIDGISGCSQLCVNHQGSFTCECLPGYQMDDDDRTCLDPDNCIGVECLNGGTCKDGKASFTCYCSTGFTGDLCGKDINECEFANGGCEDICTNTRGSFQCGCFENITLNNDGRSCDGNKGGIDVFQRYNILRDRLPKGCFTYMLMSCNGRKGFEINLTSTSNWFRSANKSHTVYTSGIVFVEIDGTSLPVSINGIKVVKTSMDFKVSFSLDKVVRENDQQLTDQKLGDCLKIDPTPKDLFEFNKAGSFFNSFSESLSSNLPNWVRIWSETDSLLDISDLRSDLVYGTAIDTLESCEGAPVHDDRIYTVYRFGSAFNITVYGNQITLPNLISGMRYCLIVDVCPLNESSVFLMIPKESRKFMQFTMEYFLIEPRGIGLSFIGGVNVGVEDTTLKFWNGEQFFFYPLFKTANMWIGGEINVDVDLDIIRFVVDCTADTFLSLKNVNTILSTIVSKGIHNYVKAQVVNFIITLRLFGQEYQLFPDLQAQLSALLSLGGSRTYHKCGNISDPQGFFFSFVLSVNPFRDVPVLRDWVFDARFNLDLYLNIHQILRFQDDLNTILRTANVNEAIDEIKHTLDERAVINVTNSATEQFNKSLEDLQNANAQLLEAVSDSDYIRTIEAYDNFIYAMKKVERHSEEFSNFINNISIDIDYDSRGFEKKMSVLKKNINNVSRKYITFFSKNILDVSNIGLRFKASITVLSFVIGLADIEVVYATKDIGECSRFTSVYTLFQNEKALRFIGRISDGRRLGPFLKTDRGFGLGGALSLDQFKFNIRVNVFINILGIKTTVDLFLTSSLGFFFYMEGNIWDIFYAQVDVKIYVSQENSDWFGATYKLRGKFVANQTDSTSFQRSYLDGLKKATNFITDEANKRISFAQNALSSAQNEFVKAKTWLENKKGDLRKANSDFDKAVKYLQTKQSELEKAKEPYLKAVKALQKAQKDVDNLCKIQTCRSFCIPGLTCKWKGQGWGRYLSCSWTDCMIKIQDPICVASNILCSVVRGIAYAALEAAEISVRAPLLAFDTAKAVVYTAQLVVDKSRFVLTLAEGALEIAKVGLDISKGAFEQAKKALEAVKIVIGAATKVLQFVIDDGIQSILDVKNCDFGLEISNDNPFVFDVQCQVNAFKLGWTPINFKVNFKNAIQSLWISARDTINGFLDILNKNINGRKKREIYFKSQSHMHALLRRIRNSDQDLVNATEEALNEVIGVNEKHIDGSYYNKDSDFSYRVELFETKCKVIKPILSFLHETFKILFDVISDTHASLANVSDFETELQDNFTSSLIQNISLQDAGISTEYALKDYNLTQDDLNIALAETKNALHNDPQIIEINAVVSISKDSLQASKESVESSNLVNNWATAMNNKTEEYFSSDECADFLDCVYFSIFVLYDLFSYENLPDIDEMQNLVRDIEDRLIKLFENSTHDIESIHNVSTGMIFSLETLSQKNLFCSKAPRFLVTFSNHSIKSDGTLTVFCNASGEPDPEYWWYQDDELLLDEKGNHISIENVTEDHIIKCKAGNVVANISSTGVSVFIADCPTIGSPEFGSATIREYKNNESRSVVAHFFCNIGYDLIGSAKSKCLPNGSWNNPIPLCEIKDCGPIKIPANGFLVKTSGNTLYKSTATLSCLDGYELAGNRTIVCSSDGFWHDASITCTPLDCDRPLDIENGRAKTQNGTLYRQQAIYECDDGYAISGNYTSVCLANGTWSGFPPTCQESNSSNQNLKVVVPVISCIIIFILTTLAVFIWHKRFRSNRMEISQLGNKKHQTFVNPLHEVDGLYAKQELSEDIALTQQME